jgi:2-polyprenyl-6-hydroxyphenyl methylase/3-demethylubiquinone-9 3-methyltransferase
VIATHEAIVGSRFDALEARFKSEVPSDDPRARALVECLGPLAGKLVLDLGCGKGRFAKVLTDSGARVIGLDLSAAMLAAAPELERVRATARRLPFAAGSFDGVMAVEVFEHLAPAAIDRVCHEARRVLRPGGMLAIVDKNAWSWNARRPWLPSLAVKWVDERRGLWMYSRREPVRERWFGPGKLQERLRGSFADVQVVHVLSRSEEGRFPFQLVPATRLFALWAARAAGATA